MMNKFIYSIILTLYTINLNAQANIDYYIFQIEHKYNLITKQLEKSPKNDTLLLQRIELLDATTIQRYSKYDLNFAQYKIEDILKDIEYLQLKYKDKNIVTNNYTYTPLNLLMLRRQMISRNDTDQLHKANQDIVNYIQQHKSMFNVDTIEYILSNLENNYIVEIDGISTPDTNTYIQNFLKYTDLFNLIFPVELATTFNKQDTFMLKELTGSFAPLNRFYFLNSPELNTRRIKYLKKMISFISEILNDKALIEEANINDYYLKSKVISAISQIAQLYYINEDYPQAKLWMQTISNDNDTIIPHEDESINQEFYQELLHISLQNPLITIDKQLSYIRPLLRKEYNEDLEEKHLRPILNIIDSFETKHPNHPYLLYLKGFALFKNRYAHILDYKNYTHNIIALFDKAQKLGLENASMHFITGGIYKELGNDSLAQVYFQKAIAINPDKYEIPAQNYGAYFIDNLMQKPIYNSISPYELYTIPQNIINLANQY